MRSSQITAEIKALQTQATLLRASAATIRKRRPVEASRKERETETLELEIAKIEAEL